MVIYVKIIYDEEAHVWIAENESVGLILESESYDLLIKKVKAALPELIELNHVSGYNKVTFETLPYTEVIA